MCNLLGVDAYAGGHLNHTERRLWPRLLLPQHFSSLDISFSYAIGVLYVRKRHCRNYTVMVLPQSGEAGFLFAQSAFYEE